MQRFVRDVLLLVVSTLIVNVVLTGWDLWHFEVREPTPIAVVAATATHVPIPTRAPAPTPTNVVPTVTVTDNSKYSFVYLPIRIANARKVVQCARYADRYTET